MHVRRAHPADAEQVLTLRRALWPDEDIALPELVAFLNDDTRHTIFVSEEADGRLSGFVEVSLREQAEGCTTSPVGYLEGWYVIPGRRRQGVGAALVAAGETWACERGCHEMGSDALIDNVASRRAHTRLGYAEVERVVLFRKTLPV